MLKFLLLLALVCLGSVPGSAEESPLQLEMVKAENNHVLVELPVINFTRLYNEVPLMKLSRLYSEIPSLNFTKIYSRLFSGGSNSTAKPTTTTTVRPDVVEEPHTMDALSQSLVYQLTPVPIQPNPIPGAQNPNLIPINTLFRYAPQGRGKQLMNLQMPYPQAQQLLNGRSHDRGYNYGYPSYLPIYGAQTYNSQPGLGSGVGVQVLQPLFPTASHFFDYTNRNSPYVQRFYPASGYQLVNGPPQDLEPYLQWLQAQYQLPESDQSVDHFGHGYHWAADDYSSNFSPDFGRQLETPTPTPTKAKQKSKRRRARRPTKTQLRQRSKKRQKQQQQQQQQRRFKRFNY